MPAIMTVMNMILAAMKVMKATKIVVVRNTDTGGIYTKFESGAPQAIAARGGREYIIYKSNKRTYIQILCLQKIVFVQMF